jgi:hypothetical protein
MPFSHKTRCSELVGRALRTRSSATGTVHSRETHFLSGGFDSAKLVNGLANTCCSVIVAAAFANGLHIHRPAGKTPGDDSTGRFHVWD